MDHALEQTGGGQCHVSGAAGVARGLLVGLVFFVGIAPTITWLEFSNGIENLNIETALEMRRGGPWIIPTLMGEPRVRKPPLNAWITAAAIHPQTVSDMSSIDTPTREAAWKALSWQTRWPALLAASLTLVLAYELGRTLLGHRVGLYGAVIAATTLLFLKYSRAATTDVHLALWVTAANVCIARLIFERRIWLGLIGAGVALGMGMMSTGPVTLVMTISPALVLVIWRAVVVGGDQQRVLIGKGLLAGAIGLVLMIGIGLGWFVYAAMRYTDQTGVWWMEVFRTDPAEAATAHWYDYFKLLAQLIPWTPFFIVGLALAAVATWRITIGSVEPPQRERALRIVYAAALVIVPIIIMSFFRDRKVRYLYPLAIPCGIVTAEAVRVLLEANASRLGRWLAGVHWVILAGVTVGLCVSGTIGKGEQVRLDGSPWFAPAFGISAAVAAAVLIVTCALVQRRRQGVLVYGTLLVMLLFQAINARGNSVGRSGDGASEMLPLARVLWDKHPDIVPYDVHGQKNIPPDLAIYMNRPIKKVKQIPPGPRAQLYVVMQKRNAPEPQAEPGWRFLYKTPRDKDWWVAFVRESG
jgi:4-amino-4-deoxy-L-arabinose transferase-like glycosyltransferase